MDTLKLLWDITRTQIGQIPTEGPRVLVPDMEIRASTAQFYWTWKPRCRLTGNGLSVRWGWGYVRICPNGSL